jgi:hypothetical protein
MDAGAIETASSSTSAGVPWHYERKFNKTHDSNERVTVWLQYQTQDANGNWAWLPAMPGESGKTLSYDLDPGEVTLLGYGDGAVTASCVRLWARS